MIPLRSTATPVGPSSRTLAVGSPSTVGAPLVAPTTLEMIPLVVLYLLSIVMLKVADRRLTARAASELTPLDNTTG